MAAQQASTWHFLGEQTTLYPRAWLYEQVEGKVRICSPGSISGKHSASYLVWEVSSLQHYLLGGGGGGSGWQWYQEACWEPFAWDRSFLAPCREPVITMALLWCSTCNSTSLPTAKWLSCKPELKATSPTGWSALCEIPCMTATKKAKCITRWKDNSKRAEVERKKETRNRSQDVEAQKE